MQDIDVVIQTESEIGRLKIELNLCTEKAEAFDIMQKLINVYELRLQQFEDAGRDLFRNARDIRDNYDSH